METVIYENEALQNLGCFANSGLSNLAKPRWPSAANTSQQAQNACPRIQKAWQNLKAAGDQPSDPSLVDLIARTYR